MVPAIPKFEVHFSNECWFHLSYLLKYLKFYVESSFLPLTPANAKQFDFVLTFDLLMHSKVKWLNAIVLSNLNRKVHMSQYLTDSWSGFRPT